MVISSNFVFFPAQVWTVMDGMVLIKLKYIRVENNTRRVYLHFEE